LSRSQKFLFSDVIATEYGRFVDQMKSAAPRIGTKVECYHFETHTKTYTYRDAHGDERVDTKTWRGKVVTFKETNYYEFLSWKDVTFEGPDNGAEILRLDVEKMYMFDCIESKRKFREHRQNYIENKRPLDEQFQSWPAFEVPLFREQVLAKRRGTEQSCCVHICWYWFWSLFLLSWPYRMWFEGLSQDQKIVIKKVITA